MRLPGWKYAGVCWPAGCTHQKGQLTLLIEVYRRRKHEHRPGRLSVFAARKERSSRV